MEPATTATRALRRRAEGRLVAGVAGGLADLVGVRPIWFRLGFVAFTVVGGIGVLVYALLWWLVARRDLPDSAAQRLAARLPNAPSWTGLALLLLGIVLFADRFGLWRPNVVLGLALIGLGVALFRRDADAAAHATRPSTAGAGPVDTATRASASAGVPVDVDDRGEIDRPVEGVLEGPATLRRRREPATLGWLGFGLALLVVAVAAMLDNAGALDLRLVRYPALALLVLGAGLVVGAFVGRARWLVLPGLLLVPALLTASLIRVPLEGGFDGVWVVARSAEEIAPSYRRTAGEVVLDLSRLREPVEIAASTGLGNVQVLVPRDARVEVAGDLGAGTVTLGRVVDEGMSMEFAKVLEPKRAGGPTIVLHLRAGFGSVSVYRSWEPRGRGSA